MGICNYCTLRSIKARAQRSGHKVTVHDNHVYVHLHNVRHPEIPIEPDNNQHWVAWLMEIPTSCRC